ncbi:hypothetical protein F7Q95_23570 [Pseudomonas psychrophila]|nr:hypothetical protein F7Q95_23570 [Pseudomonas psychrophila]
MAGQLLWEQRYGSETGWRNACSGRDRRRAPAGVCSFACQCCKRRAIGLQL